MPSPSRQVTVKSLVIPDGSSLLELVSSVLDSLVVLSVVLLLVEAVVEELSASELLVLVDSLSVSIVSDAVEEDVSVLSLV